MEEKILDNFGGEMKLFQKTKIDTTKEDLLQALKDAFTKLVQKRTDKLLEDNPEDYETGRKTDCGYFNNGVGFASYGSEEDELDEDKAFDNAKEEIMEELVNVDLETIEQLFEDNKFTIALGAFLKGC